MLNDFEENLIINEQNLPRSINEFVNDFEDSDVIQLESEFELSTTLKEEASIKSIKSFDFEHFGLINRLRIISHNKLFDKSAEMESFNVNSRVPDLIELPSEIVGLKDKGTGSRVRGLPDQVHQGLEAFSEQMFQKREKWL